MTAQVSEILRHEGQELSLCSQPLSTYFELGGARPAFVPTSTALWRGYVGTWEIVDGRLYLVGLAGILKGGSAASLETVFPGYPKRVFAHWFTGTLRAPQGKLLEYVHQGYASVYERDLLFDVENGVVTRHEVRQNGVAAPSAPEGYGIAAMLTLDRTDDDEATR